MARSKLGFISRNTMIVCAIAIIISLTASVAFAYPNPLPVPQQEQTGTYTCWASAASMATAFFNGNSSNYEMSILLYCKGGPIDPDSTAAMGTVDDVVNGVQEYANVSGSRQYNSLSFTSVKYQINNNGPIVAQYPYHMIILKGYNNSSTSVTYNDPADGMGHSCSYNYLTSTLDWRSSAFWK